MNETVLLRNQIAALTKERDEWMRSLEFSLKQRDKLNAERDAWKQAHDEQVAKLIEIANERDALKDAARLALDALEKSTPKPRKGDDDYCERGWRDQSSAIAALKAVL